jgi:hypothetical protein
MRLKIFFITILFFYVNFLYSEETDLVKRKVAIIPLYNSVDKAGYDYMSNIITDSLRANLYQLDKYNLIDDRTLVDLLKKNKLDYNKMLWEDTAVKIGDILKVDVVIFGFYIAVDDKVKIYINALDYQVRKSAINLEMSGDSGLEMVNTANKISLQMADQMLKKLPPFQKKLNGIDKLAILPVNAENGLKKETELNLYNLKTKIEESEKLIIIEDEKIISAINELKLNDKLTFNGKDYKELGKILKTDYLLRCIPQKIDSKTLFIFQIIDASTGEIMVFKPEIPSNSKEITQIFENITNYTIKQKFIDESKNNKIAIGLTSSGSALALSGAVMLAVDLSVMPDQINKNIATSYTVYEKYYNAHISLFALSLSLLGAGVAINIVSVPFFIKGNQSLKMDVKMNKNIEIGFKYNF